MILLLVAALAVSEGAAQVSDPFLGEVARALRADDRQRVVAMMRYPLPVTIESVRVPFAGPSALLERFDEVFTPEVRNALDSALTVEHVNGQPLVTAITVLPPRADAGSAGAVASGEPRRIAVRAGPRPTRVAGSLANGGTDLYLVFVPKGQLLQVRLERGRTEAAIEIVNAATGATVPGAAKGVFTGRVPESSDYRIMIRHTGSADAPPLPYLLSVSIR